MCCDEELIYFIEMLMTLSKQIKNKKHLYLIGIFFILALLLRQFIVINITPSMPKGVYFKKSSPLHRGDIILFCLDQKYQQIGLEHHYLETGKYCNGASALIKEVVAVPGDEVTLLKNAIIVNRKRLEYQTQHQDSNHTPLSVFPRGNYTVNAFWVIGTHSQLSWDSRYFGYIPRQQIISKLIPLITWN
jgi:conjugative transfer signal peptidase TraF